MPHCKHSLFHGNPRNSFLLANIPTYVIIAQIVSTLDRFGVDMFSVFLLLAAPAFSVDTGLNQHNHATHSESKARPATPKTDVAGLFGPSNYPAEARAKRLEGRSSLVLTVDAGGMVVACRVTASSGHRELDNGSCRTTRRLRFEPARDEQGRRIASEYPIQADWRLGTT